MISMPPSLPGPFFAPVPRPASWRLALPALLALAWIVSTPTVRSQDVAAEKLLSSLSGPRGDEGGAVPLSPVVQGRDGNFYGTSAETIRAGSPAGGTVYRVTPAGEFTVLHYINSGGLDTSPGAVSEGKSPAGPLIQGTDGNFYGTTSGAASPLFYGSAPARPGTVFKVTPDGAFTTLHVFAAATDGSSPTSGVIQAADGNFYGTATAGGAGGYGVIFKLTPEGLFTILHAFAGDGDGGYPRSGLVQGADGALYGTTSGFPYGDGPRPRFYGTVYRVTTDGVFKTLHPFAGGAEGGYPATELVQGQDGNFYGATHYSADDPGAASTVFRVTPAGQFTTLVPSGYNTNTLLADRDGSFYGTNSDGAEGSFFRMTPDGVVTKLYLFFGGERLLHGISPTTGVIRAADGSFYGTHPESLYSPGEVYKLTVLPAPSTFFAGQILLNRDVYYLQFPGGTHFGYYAFLDDPRYVYHFGLGYEYVFDAADGVGGVYLYDFASNGFFYTSPIFPFPYLYDFSLHSVVYYYLDPSPENQYNIYDKRYFYVFGTGKIVSK